MAYIVDLNVSLNDTEEQNLQAQGYMKINVDLNAGEEGSHIYMWYKKGESPAITKLQVTFNDEMAVGLINAGYTKIPKDLNAGAGGDYIYLWYFRGSTEYDTPIVEIDVTTVAKDEGWKFSSGWERLACDLNRKTGGNWIHAWVKREKQTYICNVTATQSYGSHADLFQEGYIRVDENTNRDAGGATVFLWYRQTTDPKNPLKALQISTNDRQYQELQEQSYRSVSVNLNEGTCGDPVYLWFNNEGFKPIKAITVLVNQAAVQWYEKAGVNVIKRDLNTGNGGKNEYLCYYQ